MSRERVLERRLRTLSTLEESVAALRALSAQHFRTAREPLASVRRYREEVERFRSVLDGPFAATSSGPPGIVLITADLGLVGEYTARLVREALELRGAIGPGPILCLGHRAVSHLARAGVVPESVDRSPSSIGALTTVLLPLVDTLLELRRGGRMGDLWLVAARFEGAGGYTPRRVQVLPVAPGDATAGLAPSPWCGRAALNAVVVRELLYAALYETLVEALASEHGKRLVTAEAARSWLASRIAELRRQVASLRRETSTQEVLEVVAASRATRGAVS
ncbi:MAG: F0F1 ATP synthase subunit gamma [Spirochaetaceae bacterium]|nr:F0F1 ATP synthase subunit gamma [Myxococcales bacterium]MCB9724468.1 F0F1 ATP synthase subunit gamma [Spirochaetaceae bacterium]